MLALRFNGSSGGDMVRLLVAYIFMITPIWHLTHTYTLYVYAQNQVSMHERHENSDTHGQQKGKCSPQGITVLTRDESMFSINLSSIFIYFSWRHWPFHTPRHVLGFAQIISSSMTKITIIETKLLVRSQHDKNKWTSSKRGKDRKFFSFTIYATPRSPIFWFIEATILRQLLADLILSSERPVIFAISWSSGYFMELFFKTFLAFLIWFIALLIDH